MAKATLYKQVALLRDRFSPNLQKYPLDMLQLIPTLIPATINKHPFTNIKLCGLVYPGKKEDTIMLNANRTAVQQNFDVTHEFIHLTMHRDIDMGIFSCFENLQTSTDAAVQEWQANEGAAELLVPYSIFLPMVKEDFPNINHLHGSMHAYKVKLAGYFNVPIATINYRFKSLEYELQQYDMGVPLNEIEILSRKKQEKTGVEVKPLGTCGNLRLKSQLTIEA